MKNYFKYYPAFAGLPLEFIKNIVSLKISLTEAKSNKIIYSSEPERSYWIINGIYYNKGRAHGINILFKEIIEDFAEKSLIEIKRHLKK